MQKFRASRSNDVVETPSVETPVVKIAEILDEYEPDEDSVFDDEEDFEDDEEFDEDSEM